jgi:integrase
MEVNTMEIVQPIREIEKIHQIQSILKNTNTRDYIMFNLGIYTGLRISDILKLKVKDVRNQDYISMTKENREIKTGKSKILKISPNLKKEISDYIKGKSDDEFLFRSKKGNFPIQRIQAYRILNDIVRQVGIKDQIGTHTLRKTFGYHFYNKYNDNTGRGLTILQQIFNHSTPYVTLRYIGITQDQIDDMIDDFEY